MQLGLGILQLRFRWFGSGRDFPVSFVFQTSQDDVGVQEKNRVLDFETLHVVHRDRSRPQVHALEIQLNGNVETDVGVGQDANHQTLENSDPRLD